MSILAINVNNIIKRGLIVIINALLGFYLALQFTNLNFSYIILGVSVGVSILIGDILLPFLIFSVLIVSSVDILKQLLLYSSLTSTNEIIRLVGLFAFLFVIPVLHYVLRKNVRSLITSGTLVLSLYNPFSATVLYFAGISFSESFIDAIYSFLPFIYMFFTYPLTTYLDISVFFTLLGALLYSINENTIPSLRNSTKGKFISVIGVAPLAVASYIFFNQFPTNWVYYALVISLVINILDRLVVTTLDIRETKKVLLNSKSVLNKEINNMIMKLSTVKNDLRKEDRELGSVIDTTVNSLMTLQTKLSDCNNLKCLDEIRFEINNQKRIVNVELNNFIFEYIRSYNEFAEKIREKGINIPELEYPKEEISIDSFETFYKKLKQVIDSNVFSVVNILNNIISIVKSLLGMNIDKIAVVSVYSITDKLKELNFSIIDKEINLCLNKALELTSLFGEENYELRESLSNLTVQKISVNKLNNCYKIMEKVNSNLILNLTSVYESVKMINNIYKIQDVANLLNIINITLQTLQKEDIPYCQKISNLYNFISEIREAVEITMSKDALLHLGDLVEALLPKIEESGILDLTEIGINEKYAPFIIALLSNMGYTAKLNGNVVLVKAKH